MKSKDYSYFSAIGICTLILMLTTTGYEHNSSKDTLNKGCDILAQQFPCPLHGRVALQYRQQAIRARAEWLFADKQDRLTQGGMDDICIPMG